MPLQSLTRVSLLMRPCYNLINRNSLLSIPLEHSTIGGLKSAKPHTSDKNTLFLQSIEVEQWIIILI